MFIVVSAGTSNVELLGSFLRHKRNPDDFYRALSRRATSELPFEISGQKVLDLGCGRGWDAEALAAQGATVTALDLDAELLRTTPLGAAARLVGDGRQTPFLDESFDGVYCSNVLEHTPDPGGIIDEVARLVRPGGWVWMSWTNWYSPVGGHELRFLHYLGPNVGGRIHDRLFGTPEINAIGDGLWPTHIGSTLRLVENHPTLELIDAVPRYYPSQRWILKVPGVREVLTWNCALTLRRRPAQSADE
ncbi:MAG: SAM-dependent methyltransferase [Candidatus Azotimanducaceae bacterium]